jgi:hypothetical protein
MRGLVQKILSWARSTVADKCQFLIGVVCFCTRVTTICTTKSQVARTCMNMHPDDNFLYVRCNYLFKEREHFNTWSKSPNHRVGHTQRSTAGPNLQTPKADRPSRRRLTSNLPLPPPPPQVTAARSLQMDPSEPTPLFPGQGRRPIESLPRNRPLAGCAAGSSPSSPSQSTRVDAFR